MLSTDPLCFAQTQITNPMFNNELAIADDSSDDDDDDVMFVNAQPVEKVRCSRDLRMLCDQMLRSGCVYAEQGELQLDELSDLRSTFEACDSDKSGGMDLEEWEVVLKLWGVTDEPRAVATELVLAAKQGYAKLGGSTKAEFQALVDSIGMPWGIEDPVVDDLELSFPEFMHLMVSGVRPSSASELL